MLSSSSAFLRSQQIDLMTQYPKSVSELASRHSRKVQIHPDTIREMIRASSSNLAAKLPANDDESARYAAMFSDL
jgi:predicted transcriptional regulator